MRDGDHRGKARPVSAPRPIKDARDEQPPRQPTRDKVAPIVTEPIGPEVRARFLGEGLKAPVRTGGELLAQTWTGMLVLPELLTRLSGSRAGDRWYQPACGACYSEVPVLRFISRRHATHDRVRYNSL